MNITKLALENSRITAAAIFLICLIGVTTYLSYPSAEDPSITIRSVKITANYPGMEPERVEELITKPLEEINPEVASHIAYVGYGGQRFFLALSPVDPDPRRAFVLVNTPTYEDVAPLMRRINAFMDKALPAARADAKKMWFGASEPGLVKLRLIGPNGEALAGAASALEDAFYAIPGTVGV